MSATHAFIDKNKQHTQQSEQNASSLELGRSPLQLAS